MGIKIQKDWLCWLFFCLFVFFLSSDKGLAFIVKVTETIFTFNFSLFSSDTDEEEINRLAEAAVSGHSIIKNGKVTLHLATKKRLECALFSACILSFVGGVKFNANKQKGLHNKVQ